MATEAVRQPVYPTHASSSDSASEITHVEADKFEPIQREPTIEDVVNLPLRMLSNDANLNEYTQETVDGQLRRTRTDATGHIERYELVTFKMDDPENPKNWSKAFKWWCTMCVAVTCFAVAFNSAVITADLEGVGAEFHVSEEVTLLTITLFVVGFGVGPMVFAPLSEIYGRRPVYGVTLALAVIFTIPGAVAQNIGTLLVTRFIAGVAFSAPMSLVGGTLVDLWKNEERGVPMAAFSAAPFIGPGVGPLVGGYLSEAGGWRWLYWIQLIISFCVWILITFTVPETYAPRLLANRAKKLRKETGDAKYVTEQDLDSRPFSQKLTLFLLRPFQLLFQELIVFFISLYMSVLYGLLLVRLGGTLARDMISFTLDCLLGPCTTVHTPALYIVRELDLSYKIINVTLNSLINICSTCSLSRILLSTRRARYVLFNHLKIDQMLTNMLGLQRRKHRTHVHSAHRWRASVRCVRTIGEQALHDPRREA
jgi:multidrug resistance protein